MKDEALKLALKAAYLAGFNASGEGYNGEYPFQSYNEHPEQDAAWGRDRDNKLSAIKQALSAPVPEGWKMVPIEPTREMWTAVNKLDDQMAAGNYDGKGCSIEQAWNCLLDAAPTPPAAQRQWQSLTDEEILKLAYPIRWQEVDDFEADKAVNFAQMVEAKLKAKNT
jgi:hypothetical protein